LPFLIEKRQLVTPGDLLAEGDFSAGENTYQVNSHIYASRVGLADFSGRNAYVVALKGCYIPVIGDLVIGKVVETRLGAWIIDINAPYVGVLFTSEAFGRSFDSKRDEMANVLDVGDLIAAKVISFDRTKDPALTIREPGLGRITRGHIIKISPTKVPRLIGKKGSMIGMIKKETNCQVMIGQNGYVLVSGTKPELEALAILSINTIERDAQTSGLTDRISELLKKEKEKITVGS
jgi:exosome complex component RRP4